MVKLGHEEWDFGFQINVLIKIGSYTKCLLQSPN
jgi:hypothetical protein